jgi:gliding motility-associated-like protein
MKKIILIFICIFTITAFSQTLMPVGPQSTTFSSMTRGYHFTAPVAFNLCALHIPPDANTGTQDIRVVRFTAGAPPAYAGTTTSYVTLLSVSGVASTTTVTCNIPINVGDIIGIYGSRSSICANSYGAANVATTIMGMPTILRRSGTQNCLGSTATWPLPIWSEVAFNIGRIYMFYNCCPTPTITAVTSPTSVCSGASIAILGGGATTYTWMPGSSNSSSITVTPTVTTSYTLSGSTAGCTGTKTVSVIVNPTPTISVLASNSVICSVGSTSLIASGASTYTWSNGITNGVAFSPTVTSTYTVIGSSALGCTNTAVRTISVNPIPIISVNSPTLCSGFTTTLIPTGASTYSWSTGVSSSSIAVSPTLTTNYTVTGTSLGCSASTLANVAVSSSPTLSVNNATICAGQTATLIASGALLYAWSTASISNSISVSPLTTTTYTVIGTNAIGCTSASLVTVVVNPMPIVSVNSPTICSGQTATLTASGASSYSWNTGSLLNPILVSPTASTVYSVTGTSLGCSTTTVVTVIANPLPVMSVNSSTICIGQTTTLTASGANSYLWNTGSTSNPFIISPLVSTTYTVVGSTLGCTQLAISTVIVNPLPILSANSASMCSGQSSLLSATGANTYTWSPGINLNTTTGSFVSANPSTSITYTILGTSISGCVNSTTSSLFVLATPSLIAVANPSAVCAGTSIDLTVSGALNYTWTPAGVFTSSLTITPASTSVYSVLGENVSGGLSCTSTQTVLVTVLSPGVVTTSNTDSLCIGESKVVFATGGTTYSWVPTVGVTNPNAASTLVKPTVTTEYTVTVSTNGLCPGTGTVKIIVNPLPIVYAGNDTTINIDEAYVLNGTSNVTNFGFLNPAGTVLSCNFCSVVEVTPKVNTCYLLKAESSQQCVAYDEVCIKVTKEYGLFIPNAFSPNGDIDNDLFIPVGYGLTSIKLTVFDRWGTQVFKSHNDVLGWDGKCKGKICEQGVYVFYVVAQTIGGKEITKTGHLTLLSRVK